ncbi:MAG: hypothetical protein AAGM38_16125, partial [Pseudomonadota bacterium]
MQDQANAPLRKAAALKASRTAATASTAAPAPAAAATTAPAAASAVSPAAPVKRSRAAAAGAAAKAALTKTGAFDRLGGAQPRTMALGFVLLCFLGSGVIRIVDLAQDHGTEMASGEFFATASAAAEDEAPALRTERMSETAIASGSIVTGSTAPADPAAQAAAAAPAPAAAQPAAAAPAIGAAAIQRPDFSLPPEARPDASAEAAALLVALREREGQLEAY